MALIPTASWPRRRWLAWLALWPIATGLLVIASGARLTTVPTGWLALAAVAGTLGSAVLASYVPAQGWRPDVGCSPCAAVAAVSVFGATMAMRSYGADTTGPLLAVAVTLFGLSQRLGDNGTCATVSAPRTPTARDRGPAA